MSGKVLALALKTTMIVLYIQWLSISEADVSAT